MLLVPPQYTRRTCSNCGCTDNDNRPSQAVFNRTPRGFEINADLNGALNMLAAGYSVSACGAEMARAATMKQEPARGASNRASTDRNPPMLGGGGCQTAAFFRLLVRGYG
ncbi:MAG: transposase [Desulfovibrio sp.]|nr:transposase [Desulfovibrio sp.]